MNINYYDTRVDLLKLIPQNSIFCEIGVFCGEFSRDILKINKPQEMWMVDIWQGSWGSGDKDGNFHKNIQDMEKIYLNLYHQTKNKNNTHVVRCSSSFFLDSCDEDYFDAIYIDGDHTYDAVLSDLNKSFRAIKNDGFLMGHDYHYNIGGDVVNAVHEFCRKHDQVITCIAKDGCPSFLIKIKK